MEDEIDSGWLNRMIFESEWHEWSAPYLFCVNENWYPDYRTYNVEIWEHPKVCIQRAVCVYEARGIETLDAAIETARQWDGVPILTTYNK